VRTVATALPIIVLFSVAVSAQTVDSADSVRGIACWPEPEALLTAEDLAADEAIEVTTGDADIAGDGSAQFTGPITMRAGPRLLRADNANFDAKTSIFAAEGGIEFVDGEGRVTGDSVRYDTLNGVFTFTNGTFELPKARARGTATTLEISRAGYLQLEDVQYSSCPLGNDDWLLKAKSIEIDANEGRGTARNATLRFKKVPILYLPYFTYPVSDERKSGLLFPKIGNSDRRGFELETPFYWNIRPNMDATIVPHYMSERGLQLGTEYRFLTRSTEGDLWGDYLQDDDETGEDRWRYDIESESFVPWQSRATLRATGVSDDNYFVDFSSNRQKNSLTALDRRLDLERYGGVWSLFFRVQDFQTIDPAIQPEDEPYAQLPQFVANGEWRDGLLGLDYRLETEAVYFHRKDSVNGARLHVQPEISLPIKNRGFYLMPEVALDYTGYKLQDQPVDQPDDPSRAAPIGSIDTGAIFERLSGKNNGLLVTLEPRALYTYIPFRDQSDIPIFDTILPDFNLVQLFRKNRFIGYDRLSDTNQLSVGISSRVLDSGNGREILTATIGQTRYFDTGNVTLPGIPSTSIDASNYIAELDIRAWEKWNAGLELQWDSERDRTDRSSVRLQYKPGQEKAINVGYRYVRDSLEQADLSFAWPIKDSWKFIGRYNYSIPEQAALDRFAGIEYESCCWAIRLLGRRSKITRDSRESDTSVSFQFELKGFSNVGSGSIGDLERGILGDWTH
jgi:LPS-assembly protein